MRFASGTFIRRGDMFALQRRDANAPTNPNKLSLFGGSGEPGETAHDCAVRELREETSLQFRPDDVVPIMEYYRSDARRMQYIFELRTSAEDFEVFEGLGFEWHHAKELIDNQETTLGFQEALRKYMEMKGKIGVSAN